VNKQARLACSCDTGRNNQQDIPLVFVVLL